MASEVYRSLDELRREVGEVAVAERIRGLPIDFETMNAAALWLRDQYLFTTKPSPRYGLWYFDTLMHLYDSRGAPEDFRWHIGGMAVVAWVSSQLLALEDHARCEDGSGGLVYRSNWERDRRAQVRRVWDALDTKGRAAALRVAKVHVEAAAARPPDPQPCGSGRVAMQAAMEAGRCRRAAESEIRRDDYVGGSVFEFQLCDGNAFATFVDDETWEERREAVRARYWESLFSE